MVTPIDPTEVYGALALIEQFEELLRNLDAFAKNLPPDKAEEFKVHLERFRSLTALMDSDEGVVFYSGKLSGNMGYQSTVERLGIASAMLRERQAGRTIQEIAKMFGVNRDTASRFFNLYDKAKPKEKLRMNRTSIFDTAAQMEELAVAIQRNMSRLEGMNDDVNVKFYAEQRQLIEAAAKFAKAMADYQKYQELIQVVRDILMAEIPERRVHILKVFQEHGFMPASGSSYTPPNLIEAQVSEL
jgi:predicted transcriptional regulator